MPAETRLIDANAQISKLDEMIKSGEYDCDLIAYIKSFFDKAQTVDAEPVRHGRWIPLSGWCNRGVVKCSECGNTLDMHGVNAGRGDANLCPNCGAKMNGGADND